VRLEQKKTPIGRRQFLQTSAAGLAGLVLSGQFQLKAQDRKDAIALNAWVRIGADDTVTLIASQAEMGQGAGTTLPAILAEELGADWKRVRLEQAPVDTAYRNPRINWQFTGNSESTTGFFDLLRQMGASARTMLVAAAAEQWNVPPEECVAESGVVLHPPSGRKLRFGELAERASHKTPPKDVELKQPAEWKLLGKALGRVDIPSKLDGSAVFGMDFRIPGMVYAAIALTPTFGGKVKKYDRTPAISMPGVVDVVEIPDGIAVVADSYWRARKALAQTPIEWEDGPNASLNTPSLMAQYRAALDGDQWMRVKLSGFPPASGETITAEYESQFMAHATMEPMNCTARVTKDQCEIWGPIQGQELTRLEVAQALQMAPERVQVNRTFLGGGFGRRLWTDFSRQAALISRAVGRPVQVIWSRETDMQHDIYRPAVLHRITAKVDSAGKPLSLSHRLVSPSILQYVYPPVTQAPFDPSCLEGALEWHYRIPHWEVEFHQPKVAVPTSVLRTTGYGPNLFAIESLIDELAHRAKEDPYLYRRELLAENTRAVDLLDLAAEKGNWKQKPAGGRFRGIAFAEAFRTMTAHVVELSVRGQDVTIHKVTCAFDCGTALDPDICRSSMEAGIAWGLTCAFKSEIRFEKGGVQQSNFHDYPLMSMAEMPPVEVYYRNSDTRLLGGTGEVGPVTVVPALTNAIFAATGMRYRSLPLSRSGLRMVSIRA
jgi:isoquinoline 1-oxidoreductase beta subunit